MSALPRVEPPFPVTAPHRVVPAPRPLGDAPHVVVDDAWPRALQVRLRRLREDRDGVVVGSAPTEALEAAHRLLPPGAVERALSVPEVQEAVAGTTGAQRLLLTWLLACSDDLVVLRRRGTGVLEAELLAVAFPSGWPPRHRLGASLLELHAPVADGERLQRAAPALSEALLTKGPLLQHVWGLDPDGRLDRDPSSPFDVPGPGGWHLRVERQTTLPLPDLDRALFLIRPYLVPLRDLTADQRDVLQVALDSLSPAARAYKGVPDQFCVGSSG